MRNLIIKIIFLFIVISIFYLTNCTNKLYILSEEEFNSPIDYSSVQRFFIIYDGNGNTGGTAPIDNKKYRPGEEAIVLDNSDNFFKTGYIVGSWNTKSDGSGTKYNPKSLIKFNLENITLYAIWVDISSEFTYNDLTYRRENGTFILARCDSYEYEIEIPNNFNGIQVTSIGYEAFRYTIVKKITIPDSVTYIGRRVFSECSGLNNIFMYPLTAPTLGTYVFAGVSNCTLHIKPDATGYSGGEWDKFTIVKDL